MQIQFRRLGLSDGVAMGRVGVQDAMLCGELSLEQGIWWGEGLVTNLEPLTVEVLSKLSVSQVETRRLEVLFPVTKQPWFAVDLTRLYEQSETHPTGCHTALRSWAPRGFENQAEVAQVEMGADDASGLFHMLLNQPTTHHCLDQVHDGSAWSPWSEHHMVVCYSRKRMLTVYPDSPPPGSESIENCAFHTPFWVDLYRGEKRLIRWGQPMMLKRRRYL